MNAPHCPEHHDLIRDLALGRLDDTDARTAEAARTSCATCRDWWEETFTNDAVVAIDRVVGDALTSVALPPRRRQRPWLAAAAAAFLMVAAGALWNLSQAPVTVATADLPEATIAAPTGEIATIDFENGALPQPATDALVILTFESATPEVPVVDDSPNMIAALDFESGDFGDFVPVT